MLLKLNYRFINFSIIIKLNITEASTVQCTQRCSVDQKVWGSQQMLQLPIKSAKTITTLDPMF